MLFRRSIQKHCWRKNPVHRKPGSRDLCNHLIDVLYTWIFPLTPGKGKKLFEEGTQAQQWKLTDSVVSAKGVIIASYVPDGEVKQGSFVPDKVSEAELARREKWSLPNPEDR